MSHLVVAEKSLGRKYEMQVSNAASSYTFIQLLQQCPEQKGGPRVCEMGIKDVQQTFSFF